MTIVKRLVILLPGFEHMPVEAHHRRFVREAGKTAPVYDMTVSEPSPYLSALSKTALPWAASV